MGAGLLAFPGLGRTVGFDRAIRATSTRCWACPAPVITLSPETEKWGLLGVAVRIPHVVFPASQAGKGGHGLAYWCRSTCG